MHFQSKKVNLALRKTFVDGGEEDIELFRSILHSVLTTDFINLHRYTRHDF